MAITRLFLFIAVIILLPVHACTESSDDSRKASFEQQTDIMEIRPQSPVKIKMKRNAVGEYSSELKGDDADKVMETDRKLKEGLKD